MTKDHNLKRQVRARAEASGESYTVAREHVLATTALTPTVDVVPRDDVPISVLLSHALIAFTIEFDNEYERRIRESGYYFFNYISMVGWFNLMRFLRADSMTIGEFVEAASLTFKNARTVLCGLERWLFIDLEPPDAAADRPRFVVKLHATGIPINERYAQSLDVLHGLVPRDGFGGPTRLDLDWRIHPTPKAVRSFEIWDQLSSEIEARWQVRYGKRVIASLRSVLVAIVAKLGLTLPMGLPDLSPSWRLGGVFPPVGLGSVRTEAASVREREAAQLPLAALFAQAVCAFGIEYNTESDVPIALAANLLRVLDKKGIPVTELGSRTGLFINLKAWHTRSGLLETGKAEGRNVARLTPTGFVAQSTYKPTAALIENRWADRFGNEQIAGLRTYLGAVLDPVRLAEGLTPPPGVPRAGDVPSTKQSASSRDHSHVKLTRQTGDFIRDPADTMPHYPVLEGPIWAP